MADVRAKMRVNERKEHPNGVTVKLQAVYAEDGPNKAWSKWTPYGELVLDITNPEAHQRLPMGKTFYVDLTLTEE